MSMHGVMLENIHIKRYAAPRLLFAIQMQTEFINNARTADDRKDIDWQISYNIIQ